MKKKILLVDGNALIFRAFYSSFGRVTLTTKSGIPTNAVYSFINMLFNIIQKNDYYDIKIAFDKGKKTFRHDKLEDYKGGRKKTPDELVKQFPIVREFLTQAKIDWFELDGFEADDIIGTISEMYNNNQDFEVEILTSDQDMYQLISDNVFVLSPQTGTSDMLVYDKEKLFEKWGIKPEQVIDYKGLRGDSSDNIKGVAGIGEKTAKELLQSYNDLENLYANIEQITGAKKQKLIDGKDDAFLSREIATIHKAVPLEGFELRKTNVDFSMLKDFFIKYEMNSLIRKYAFEMDSSEEPVIEQVVIKNELKEVKTWENAFNGEKNFLYLEILNDNYHNPDVIGLGISNEKGNFFYIPGESQEISIFNWQDSGTEENFQHFLDTSKFYTYDVKKTIYALKKLGYNVKEENFVYDMMIACYVINSNVKSNFESHLNLIDPELEIETFEEVFGKGVKKTKQIDQVKKSNYIVSKAVYIKDTMPKIYELLQESGQTSLYENIELPFCFVLLNMEEQGVLIDREELKVQTQNVLELLNNYEIEANEILAKEGIEPINYASPKQLKETLFDKMNLPNTSKGSTDKEALEALEDKHPLIEKVLKIRKYSKLYSTYLKGFEKYIDRTNKVHTIYNQTLTNTGRLSSSEPNLQNISVRDEDQRNVRKIFIAPNGYKYISLDYSQIELRVLADIANEKVLINAYANNIDIHELAARNIFSLKEDEKVTSEQRRIAKVFNFGILYGLTKFGLSKDLKISHKEAEEYIKAYNKSFPEIENFKKEIIDFGEKNGYVETQANRRRYIYELQNSNYMVREFGKRAAVNAPVQGTAADILKVAMIELYQNLKDKGFEAKMVSQIHDEIIILAPENEVQKAKELAIEIMNKAYNKLFEIVGKDKESRVLLEVNEAVGNNWFELK